MIKGIELKNIPWEDRPPNCNDVLWRYSQNPIIEADAIPTSNSIFNSAAVPFKGKFAGVFRCDNKQRRMRIHAGFSDNAIDWKINEQKIEFKNNDPEISNFEFAYDPRVCWIEDRYYITWCNGYHGPTIGVAYTYDFKEFFQLENAFLPYNRNGVLFPRKINGKYLMLSRPSGTGHNLYGDIFLSQSPDMCHWGGHRHVMERTVGWQSVKIGAGPTPIETNQGWLMFYHGVLESCSGLVYSMGAALLDLNEPWKVIARTSPYLLAPKTIYERVGDVPNVVFPCAALCDSESGKIAVYYGAADTVTALAFGYVDEIIEFIKQHNSENLVEF